MTTLKVDAPELTVLAVYCRPDEEEENEEPNVEQEEDAKKAKAKKTMVRRRMKIRSVKNHATEDDEEYETAMIVPVHGLTQSLFYHNDMEEHEEYEESDDEDEEGEEYPVYELNMEDRIYEERTLLLQSYEHYDQLANDPHTSSYFEEMKQDGKIDPELVLEQAPRFGEQLIVKGLDAKQICVGDIFAFKDNSNNNKTPTTGLVIEVTSPRLCCAEVDKKSCSPFGRAGLRRHTNTHGMGGWFVRVIQAGEVQEGMTLCRVANPHPKWTLAYIAKALYGECDTKYHNLGWAQWNRNKAELQELCSLEQLGWYEWKDEAQWILDRWDKIQKEKQDKEKKIKVPAATTTTKPPSASSSSLLKLPASSQSYASYLKSNLALLGVGLVISHQWEAIMVLLNNMEVTTATTSSLAAQLATNITNITNSSFVIMGYQ